MLALFLGLALLLLIAAGLLYQVCNRNAKSLNFRLLLIVPFALLAGFLYWLTGNPEKVLKQQQHRQTLTTFAQSQQQVVDSPRDANAWLLLAQSSFALANYQEAVVAYQSYRQLVGDSADLLVREAQARILSDKGSISTATQNLLKKALKLNPQHPLALFLLGYARDGNGSSGNSKGGEGGENSDAKP